MPRAVVILVVLLAVAGCSTPLPSVSVTCGDLAAGDCAPAADAAPRAVNGHAPAGFHPPVRVDLGAGQYCANPANLFSKAACLANMLPVGGQRIGHATVNFDGSAEQGFLNIDKNGSTFSQL
ncbi:MAG: hypothetical protein ABSA21_12970 [Candidatus Limnocylindrales bacterium]|jgi:hypothetical protein